MKFQSCIRNRIGLFMASFLVAGLFACAQSPTSQEADARQASSGHSAPAVVRVTVARGTQVHVTLFTSVTCP